MGILVTVGMLFVAYKMVENGETGGATFIGIIGLLFAASYLIGGANKAKEVVGKKSRRGGMRDDRL